MNVFDWMTQTKLKLNPSKTELSLIECEFKRQNLAIFPIPILDNQIRQRYLGVLFDRISFRKDICQLCIVSSAIIFEIFDASVKVYL